MRVFIQHQKFENLFIQAIAALLFFNQLTNSRNKINYLLFNEIFSNI